MARSVDCGADNAFQDLAKLNELERGWDEELIDAQAISSILSHAKGVMTAQFLVEFYSTKKN